ncbi:hypothetical protein CAAN3_10S03136 [[Candida] anglica]
MPKPSRSKNDSKVREDDSDSFGLLDILRVAGGLLLINAVLSYWFTSTSTWGYDGRWLDPRYVHFRTLGHPVTLSEGELSLYNGSDPSLPIYIAIDGRVYDVTKSRSTYGPGGSYSFFSGKDGARAFVTGCFNKPDEFTHDLRGLDEQEARQDVQEWQDFYQNHKRYWYVGQVLHEELTGEIPESCEHMKFPGHH